MRIRKWDEWQNYRKDRGQPPWIKVYRSLMRDANWVSLSDAQRGQLVAMWMLAADKNGELPSDPALIKKLCFMDSEPNLKVFVDEGFMEDWQPVDAKLTPERRQVDRPETEESRDREETDKNTVAKDATAPAPVSRGRPKFDVVNTGTPQAAFVDRFKAAYELKVGEPYKPDREDYVIADRLLKQYGEESVITKVKVLGGLCERRSAWFTKDGWASFTIKKLSNQWNSIIPEANQPTKDEEFLDELRKQEAQRAAVDRAIRRR